MYGYPVRILPGIHVYAFINLTVKAEFIRLKVYLLLLIPVINKTVLKYRVNYIKDNVKAITVMGISYISRFSKLEKVPISE